MSPTPIRVDVRWELASRLARLPDTIVHNEVIPMSRVMISILLGSAVALSASALADDSSTPTHKARKELMQQCMDQQKAQNGNASEKDMKKICHDQVKMEVAQQRAQNPQQSEPAVPPTANPQPYSPPTSSPMPR
jgi:hypothetical protein